MSAAGEVIDAEFGLDSDYWFNDSPPAVPDYFPQDPSPLHAFDSSRPGDTRQLLSPGPHLTLPQFDASPGSPLSSPQDSSSDASSSKRTRSSISPKTRSAGGDTMMTEDLDVKPEWSVDEFLHMEDDQTFKFEHQTINPKSIEQAYDEHPFPNSYDFTAMDSGRSSPDRDRPSGAALSPGALSTPVFNAEPRSAASRGHSKAFSVSWTLCFVCMV